MSANTTSTSTSTSTSIINGFLHARRAIRFCDTAIANVQYDMARARRQARKLELASPFNASRAARLRADADEEESYLSKITAMRLEMGRFLIDGAREFDMATTLEQRFELLNTNVADRAAVPAGAGLVDLLFVYCAEDSAAHRGDQWNDAPMGNAMRWAVLDGMANTPKGREASTKLFGELFAPGGLFYGAPTYYQHPDGTMLRQAPALVVHDAAGSRTIERRIGK